MQLLVISGNVGKDATLRQSGSDDVLSFSLAVDNGKDRNGNKRDSTWYDCSLWGDRAKKLERHITKGSKLTLQGRPTVREHNGKAYLGITIDQITFQGGGSRDNGDQGSYSQQSGGNDRGYQAPPSQGYGAGGRPSGDDLGSEIPFAAEWR